MDFESEVVWKCFQIFETLITLNLRQFKNQIIIFKLSKRVKICDLLNKFGRM